MGSSPDDRSALNDLSAFTVSVAGGSYVFRQHDAGADMFIVSSGQVALEREQDGRTLVLEQINPGDFFGEAALAEGGPRDVSARAVSDCQLIRIDGATLEKLVQELPDLPMKMLARLSRRARTHIAEERRSADAAITKAKEEAAQAAAEAQAAADAARGAAAESAPAAATTDDAQASAATLPDTSRSAVLVDAASGTTLPVPADAEEVTIGRATGVEINIAAFDGEHSVGRRHASILRRDTRFVLRDNNARNGTFLNDERLAAGSESPIADGDRLRFGLVEMLFRLG